MDSENDKLLEHNFWHMMLGISLNIVWWFSIGMQVDAYLHFKSWLVMPITFTLMILSCFGTCILIFKYRPLKKKDEENSDEPKS